MKTWTRHLLVILGFLITTFIYFAPKLDGKAIRQGDTEKFKGMIEENMEYYEKEGQTSLWCSSMFSGMPSYTIGIPGSISSSFIKIAGAVRDVIGSQDAGIVFASMLFMYILLCCAGLGLPASVLGSVAYGFSSYTLIIIVAGHITKAWVMSVVPLVLCGMYLVITKKNKFWPGVLLFVSLHLLVGWYHLQIAYYSAIICVILYIAYAVKMAIDKKTNELLRSTSVMFASVVMAVLFCLPLLYSNYEISNESIRGKSELTSAVDGKSDKSSGLDKDYAFTWSYSKMETLTLLVPNAFGGESGGYVPKNGHLGKALKANGAATGKDIQTYTYWGDQPFTSGPVYLGAIVCMLALLAVIYFRNLISYVLTGITLLFIMMSWGCNFGFNDFLFEYLPMYNKFRTPSMSLVVPQLTFAIGAAAALGAFCSDKLDRKRFETSLYISAGITGGICLVLWLFPTLLLNFESANDSMYKLPAWYKDALIADRVDLCSSDAFRSLTYIVIAGGLLWFMNKKTSMTGKAVQIVASAVALLTLVDLWSVDKRYLNDKHFVKKNNIKVENLYKPTVADNSISEMEKRDGSIDYRVLTFNNPFNDTHVPFRHHSIGGYNAAKLRRYQDLIERCIEPEINNISRNGTSIESFDNAIANSQVLNMLDMKYLIIDNSREAYYNRHANGQVWLADSLIYVDNADEEMIKLQKSNTKTTALVDKRFTDKVGNFGSSEGSNVELTYSRPNMKKYSIDAKNDVLVLFSDVYYEHGWKATIDGNEAPHFRANWIQRAMTVPSGKHEIVFEFYPEFYMNSSYAIFYLSWIMVIAIAGYGLFILYKNYKKERSLTESN